MTTLLWLQNHHDIFAIIISDTVFARYNPYRLWNDEMIFLFIVAITIINALLPNSNVLCLSTSFPLNIHHFEYIYKNMCMFQNQIEHSICFFQITINVLLYYIVSPQNTYFIPMDLQHILLWICTGHRYIVPFPISFKVFLNHSIHRVNKIIYTFNIINIIYFILLYVNNISG